MEVKHDISESPSSPGPKPSRRSFLKATLATTEFPIGLANDVRVESKLADFDPNGQVPNLHHQCKSYHVSAKGALAN